MARQDDEIQDELPEDLDASGYVGPYIFPEQQPPPDPCGALRRDRLRLPSASGWRRAASDAVLVNDGVLCGGIALVLFGVLLVPAGFDLAFDERDALVAAGRTSASRSAMRRRSSAGEACAAGRRGASSCTRARSHRRSAGSCSSTASTATVLEHFVEDNPEDWS